MVFLSSLFSSASDEPGADATFDELMAYGKRQLFTGQTEPAMNAFTRAAAAAPEDALPLAFRSWAGRIQDKDLAIADAEKAVDIDPSCAEAHMSLALAHATMPTDFEKAVMALEQGRKYAPSDEYGAVLSIGVYLLFVDVLASTREDADGFSYEFNPTPLRNAADWLLSGEHAAAINAFKKIHESGREVAAAMGLVATFGAMGDKASALPFARFLLSAGVVKDYGVSSAVAVFQEP